MERLKHRLDGADGARVLVGGLEVFPDRMRADLCDELLSEHVVATPARETGRTEADRTVAAALREGRPPRDLVPGGIDPAELVDRALAAYAAEAGR
ncbi:hypothetical protein [Actinoallomurus acaciae]|uniref:Uncharacterized protein n=1 Tax=Actinoallomurus acaciae TaxID=502577 RepID=A0ABV5YIY1_9ACTN